MSKDKKPRLRYFEEEDVLHLVLSEEPEANSVEISPDITVELNAQGDIIGIEILNAGRFLQNALLETVQAKLLISG
ncbi:MAG TPA: DUF2283 domain-containing protein [Chloroflexi bacterium]|nr:DUF2283 domain-containing protein [Chloroflexota bacterium]